MRTRTTFWPATCAQKTVPMLNVASTCLEGFWWERIISPIPVIVPSTSFLRTIKPTWLSAGFTMKTGRLPTACRWRMAAKSIVSQIATWLVAKNWSATSCRPFNWPNKIWWFWIGKPILVSLSLKKRKKPAWVWSSMPSTSVPIMLTTSISCGTTTTSTNLPMQTRWTSLLSRLTAKKKS